jgi:hypothetical protein
MNIELEKQLIAKYPSIFRDTENEISKSIKSPYFGIECGDGWYDILDTLCTTLSELYTTGIFFDGKTVILDAPKVVAQQVKEKFGSLRFYYQLEYPQQYHDLMTQYQNTDQERIIDGWANGYRDYVAGIVHFAEVLSSRTCEETGQKGTYHRSGSGWVKVLNPEVAKTHEFYKDRNYEPIEQK